MPPYIIACVAILLSTVASATAPSTINSTLELTAEEKAYLMEKRHLTIVCDPHWPPYEHITDDGKYEGISIDYHKLLAHRIGVPIIQIPTKTWMESLYLAQARECDLVSTVNKTPRRSRYLDFTPPFIKMPIVIVGREDSQCTCLEDFTGFTFAVVRGYNTEEALRRDYPSIKHFTVATTEESIKAVAEGTADATITTSMEATHLIRVNHFSHLGVLGETPYINQPGFGVQNGDALLLSIMRKAVESISEADRSTIEHKWVTASEKHSLFKLRYIIPMSIPAIFLLIYLLWWVNNKRRSSEKTT